MNDIKLLPWLFLNDFELIHHISFIKNDNNTLLFKKGHCFFEKRNGKVKKVFPEVFIKNELYSRALEILKDRSIVQDSEVGELREKFLKYPKALKNSIEYQNINNSFYKVINNMERIYHKLLGVEKTLKQSLKSKKIKNEKRIEPKKLDLYQDLFPLARTLKRKIFFFVGPTNAGKTFNALNKLLSFKSGVYLAPLRLLALEGKEEIEKRGEFCSFITGEERQIVKGSKFIAQTIETFNFNKRLDAVLIDEIQMIADQNRGWAWTQALIGAPSENIILTGSLDCVDLVKKIAKLLGDELEIIELVRFTQLKVLDNPIVQNLHDLEKLEKNTAIIVFSRKNVFFFKKKFDALGIPTSIIYGKLSPEVRREEARKFREGETKILISTDAIGMGLNLPIKHVIFGEVEKFNGKEMVELTPSEVKQIAGRAGRYLKFDEGLVSALTEEDLFFINQKINIKTMIDEIVYVKPTLDQIIELSENIKSQSLQKILNKFESLIQKQKDFYQSSDNSQILDILRVLDTSPMSLIDKVKFSTLPIDTSIREYLGIFQNWVDVFNSGGVINAKKFFYVPVNNFIKHDEYLQNAEKNINLLTSYMWLAQQYPNFAPDYDLATKIKNEMNNYIIKFLDINE